MHDTPIEELVVLEKLDVTAEILKCGRQILRNSQGIVCGKRPKELGHCVGEAPPL